MGRRLLFRIAVLIVFVAGYYVYDNYIAKPRILVTAPDAVLAAGWTKFVDPAQKFSIGVPPGFIILDPTREDYKQALAKLKKSDPESAAKMEQYALRPAAEGFMAINPFKVATNKPYLAIFKMWADHAPRLIRDDNGALKDMGQAIAKNNPEFTFSDVQKIQTPATQAFVWTGTGKDEMEIPSKMTEIAFLDKFDAFFVSVYELPAGVGPDFIDQIAQSFREYKQHTGWDGPRK